MSDSIRQHFEHQVLSKIEDFNRRYPQFRIPLPKNGVHYAEIIANIVNSYETALAEKEGQ